MVRTIPWFCLFLNAASLAHAVTAPVVISPTQTSVRGGSTKQFKATLTGITGPVTWSVNGVTGGSATAGSVSETGIYTAPTTNPGVAIKVKATAGTPPQSAEATVTWLNPEPVISSLTPAAVNIGSFTVTINGRGFLSGSQVLLNGSAIPAISISSTAITFRSSIAEAGTVSLAVANPDPGAKTSSARTLTIMPPVALTVSPATTNVRLGAAKKFTASVSNSTNKTVNWSVNGVPNGSAATGTIASDGTFTAPIVLPAVGQVTITATSVQDPNATSSSVVTFLNPLPVIQTVAPAALTYGERTLTITGNGFVPTSVLRIGNTPVTTQFVSPTQLTATVTLAPVTGGILAFRVANPDPGASTSPVATAPVGPANPKLSYLAAARFLEQASWGAGPAGIAHLQEVGVEAWLNEQLSAPVSLYAASTSSSNTLVNQQSEFFVHAMKGTDQLRQRVAFALSQIFVVSGLKTGEPRQMVPYQNMLLQGAFGKYVDLLRNVTLSPTMGVYLDMVNNDKANPEKNLAPNENYGREVMQLFSIGTVMLNPDGTQQKDGLGQPIATYDQRVIDGMARALTGWTFTGQAITKGHNRTNFTGPMIAVEANHDTGEKTIAGGRIVPPGQTAQQDLESVLDALSTHPNVAPFISSRLIGHLVKSNPSPGYVARVSQVFTASKGDLWQVIRAILLDAEARQADNPATPGLDPNDGHLRAPVVFVLAMLKNLNATVVNNNPIEGLAVDMGQNLFYAPSVFSYYSPMYRLSNGLQAPEFQLLTSGTALVRANVVQSLISRNLDGDARYDITPLSSLASQPAVLVDAVNNAFLYGRMPAEMKSAIVTAISATNSSGDRARNAIYLAATSSLYQVEH